MLSNKSTFNQRGWFLWESGCKEDNKNQSQESSLATHSKNVPRIIIWYKPPYSKTVKMSIRKENLVGKVINLLKYLMRTT